jgi:hypothetical protein
LFLLSSVFSYQLIIFISNIFPIHFGIWESFAYLSMIVFSALAYYGMYWLITPSYNWLSLISTLLVGIGLLMIARYFIHPPPRLSSASSKHFWIGTFLTGAGGALSFHSIPSAAFVLGILASFWLLMFVPVKKYVQTFGSSLIFFLSSMAMHIFIFEGSFLAYYHKLQNGILTNKLLNVGHSLPEVTNRTLASIQKTSNLSEYFQRNSIPIIVLGLALVLLMVIKICRLNDQIKSWTWKIAMAGGLSALIIKKITSSAYLNMGQVGIDLLIFMILCLGAKIIMSGTKSIPRSGQMIGMVIIISSFGVFFRFGTAAEFIKASTGGYIFYVAGFIVGILASARDSRPFFRLAVASLALIPLIFLIFHTYAKPYRLPESIRAQIYPITLSGGSTTLRVDEETRQWVASLQAIALKAGWKTGNYIIDMSGGTPGATVVLGGRAPGKPWLPGGYSGSTEYAKNALTLVDRDILLEAWILTAPGGRRKLLPEVLGSINIPFPAGYELVGEVRTGYRTERQFLWKPLNND